MQRSSGRLCTAVALAAVALFATSAVRADQRQDWMVAAPEKGTYLNLDFVVGAVQAALEQRIPVYGNANMLTLRGSTLAAIPFGSTQVDVEMRILNLTLGSSVGYMSVWRNQSFDLAEPMDRKRRRVREAAGEFNRDTFPFWQGYASLAFPLNDYVVFNHQTTYRTTDAADRSFDNITQVVHDGNFIRADFQLFLKHEAIGAIAPMVQLLSFPLDGDRKTQVNFGFMAVARAGLVRRDDLVMLQMLFHNSDLTGGYENDDVFGAALWRGPMTFLLAYRSVIGLSESD